MLRILREECDLNTSSVFLDVGSGLGKPNLHAYSIGIDSVLHRVHLVMQNLKRCAVDQRLVNNIHFTHCDVKGIGSLSPCTHVCAFDVGFDNTTMSAMADAFMNSNAKWIILYKPLATVARFGFDVTLVNQIQTTMCLRYWRNDAVGRNEAPPPPAFSSMLEMLQGDNDAYREHVSAAAAAFVNQPRARRGSGYGDDAADEATVRRNLKQAMTQAAVLPGRRSDTRRKPLAARKRKRGRFTNKTTREQRAQRIAGTSCSCLPDAVGHLVPALAESAACGAMLACIPEDGVKRCYNFVW